MSGRLGGSITQSLNPAPTLCVLRGCSSRFGIYYTPRASSVVKASVRPAALLRNPRGEEVDKRGGKAII